MKFLNKNLLAIKEWGTNEIIATIWDTSKYKKIPLNYSGNLSKYKLIDNSSISLKEQEMGSKKKTSSYLLDKVLFTRASVSDVGGTVTLGRLNKAGFYVGDFGRGDHVVLTLSDGKSYFHASGHVNRIYGTSGTLYICDWPKGLKKPTVGRARKIDVVDVCKIS